MIYFVEFNHLASHIQWDDHALLWKAYKGLAHHIKNEMVHHDRPVMLLDLNKLVQGYKPSITNTGSGRLKSHARLTR